MYMRRYEEAGQVLDRAVAIAPGMRTPHFLKVNTYLWWDGTTERARQALDAVPGLHDERWMVAAWRLDVVDGSYSRALKLLESNPVERWDGVPTSFFACICYQALGRTKLAEQSCGDAVRLLRLDYEQQPRSLRTLTTLAQANAIRGDRAEALRFARAAAEVGADSDDAIVVADLAIELARIDMLVGDIDGALDRLAEVLERPAPISVAVLRNSAEWAPLRGHPRFVEIVGPPRGS
jgi:ATP/maltotriose-dependent transcriptional regulator MalT